MTRIVRFALPVFILACLGLSPSTHAVERVQFGPAVEALNANEILPMVTALEGLDAVSRRRVVEAELRHRRERWFYEVKLLRSNGLLQEVVLDARTGELIKDEQLHDDARGRGGERERGREGR